MSLKTIGKRLHLDSGTLTPLVNKLISQGYLEKTRNPGDERQLVVQLTDEGRALQKQAESIPEQLAEVLGLNENEYFAYQRMLTDLSIKLGLTDDATC